MQSDRNINWYVLFVLLERQEKLLNILHQHDIDAFAPTMEYYRRDIRSLTIKPMFPGYIFVRSEMSQIRFDDFLNQLGDQKRGMIKELKKDSEQQASGALREEEIDFLTGILDEKACMRMSYAVLRDGRAVVTDGPLAAYEEHIVKVDRHNRLAYLDLNYFDRQIQAGLTIGQKASPLQGDCEKLANGQGISQLQANQEDLLNGQVLSPLQADHGRIPQEEIDVEALRAAMMSGQDK